MLRLLKIIGATAVCSTVVALVFLIAYILIPVAIALVIIGIIFLVVREYYSNG